MLDQYFIQRCQQRSRIYEQRVFWHNNHPMLSSISHRVEGTDRACLRRCHVPTSGGYIQCPIKPNGNSLLLIEDLLRFLHEECLRQHLTTVLEMKQN
ncbi:hypothetical protein D3C85_1633290 [compost metagenome]